MHFPPDPHWNCSSLQFSSPPVSSETAKKHTSFRRKRDWYQGYPKRNILPIVPQFVQDLPYFFVFFLSSIFILVFHIFFCSILQFFLYFLVQFNNIFFVLFLVQFYKKNCMFFSSIFFWTFTGLEYKFRSILQKTLKFASRKLQLRMLCVKRTSAIFLFSVKKASKQDLLSLVGFFVVLSVMTLTSDRRWHWQPESFMKYQHSFVKLWKEP